MHYDFRWTIWLSYMSDSAAVSMEAQMRYMCMAACCAGELGQTRAQVHIKKIFSGYKGSYAARMYTSSFPKFSEVVLRGKARCSQPAGKQFPACCAWTLSPCTASWTLRQVC